MLLLANGMIRSGSTLQYNLASSLLRMSGRGQAHGYVEGEENGVWTPIHQTWAESAQYQLVKTHRIPDQWIDRQRQGIRVLYVYRDIRDVAASAKEIWNCTGDRLTDLLDNAIDNFERLERLDHVLYQRYEDITIDMRAAALEIAEFLDLDLSERDIADVIQEWDISAVETKISKKFDLSDRVVGELRKKRNLPRPLRHVLDASRLPQLIGRILGSQPVADEETLLHPDHISKRKGAVGYYRSVLTEEECRFVTYRYRDWLVQTGYIPENYGPDH